MTQAEKTKITQISQDFSEPFYENFGSINGSGIFIVDPLCGYLNAVGYENTLKKLDACDLYPDILIMTFKDGTQFIPAGEDLKNKFIGAKNWLWID